MVREHSPRLRFAHLTPEAAAALEEAEQRRRALVDTLPTDPMLPQRIDEAFASLKATLTLVEASEMALGALGAHVESIETRRAVGKTGTLVVTSIIVIAFTGPLGLSPLSGRRR